MHLFGKGIDRICAVVAATTAQEMRAQFRLALRETRTLELRLDWLRSDLERKRFLEWLATNRPLRSTLLATCRRVVGGGKLQADAAREVYWLVQARSAGCQWCDLEMETFQDLPPGFIAQYPVPDRVLLSIHDFEGTPKLPRRVHVAPKSLVDGVKIAAKARTIADSVRLLKLARHSEKFVAVPMGDVGLPARILALREGSALAYAPVGDSTAPGQVSLHDLKYLYRAEELNRQTAVFGVIGNPVGHSLSPLLHNTGFALQHMNAVYLPFLVERIGDFLACISDLGIRGFSVTLPHKQTILKYLKDCEPLAAEIGAVNTVVVRKNGSLYGCNTDYIGVLRALEKNFRIRGSRALIFGAGGSARAAAFALAQAGAVVAICARREKAAKNLARAIRGEVIPRRALHGQYFDAVLNATPVGMYPNHGLSPLKASELNCRIVMDLIYRPQKTLLLKLAERKRIKTVSGVEMFLAQGIAQWEIWTEKHAPESAMRRAVIAALHKEASGDTPRSRSAR
jgi:3-dehydroquinate dehydratase / shikimate dehydrogenase